MIVSFRSRPLQRLWERDDPRRLPQQYAERITMILDRLAVCTEPSQMMAPGLRFHALTGSLRGRYSVTVSANWRITFGWSDDGPVDVDFEDYH